MPALTGGLIATLLIPACLVLVLGGLGAAAVIAGRRAQQKAQSSQRWPTVPGTVKTSSINQHKHTRSDAEGDFDLYYTYDPVVEYEYSVLGQTLTGRRWTFGSNSFDRQVKARVVVDRYPLGASITVHYNPENPEEATLETAAGGTNAFVIVGAVFIGLAVLGCCLSIPIAFVFGAALLSG